MKNHLSSMAALAAIAAFMTSCASTKVTQRWEKQGFDGPSFKKVLVVAVFKEEVTRRTIEDEFARQMGELGIAAKLGYSVLPDTNNLSKADMEKAVTASGADALLLIRLVRVDQQTQYTPGYAAPGGLYGYCGWSWDDGYYAPPMAYQFDVVIVESKLFDARDESLVWAASTETVDPRDTSKEVQSFTKVLLGAMQKDKVL